METQQNEEDKLSAPASSTGLLGKLEDKFLEIKENAETYPYVWGSYIVVYGGFALWTGYRWRKLRKTEDRVRVLQEKLRQRYEAEQSANSVASVEKGNASCCFPINMLEHKETSGQTECNWSV